MSKNLAIFVGVGLVVIAAAVFLILSSTKGSHLELKGRVIKVRTGALSDADSIAVLDLRLENSTDVPFVVRQVEARLEKQDGSTADGALVSKIDMKQLFAYNRFLGDQYNDALSIRDKIAPHSTLDRMLAVRFEIPSQQLESARSIHVAVQDMDGALFETDGKLR
jgi:hypothetical protein